MDDNAEVKIFYFSSRCKNKFSSNWYIAYYQMHLYCVFLGQKEKKNSDRTGVGYSKNMTAIKQHAIVNKRAGEGMFFFISCSCFGLNLGHMVMTLGHMYCDMQNKLSNTWGLWDKQ